jgi:hypothetical protein
MSEVKFTKGPWKVVGFTFSDCKEQNECGFIVRANGMCASKANARVAEAAPDLYAALEAMCRNALEIGYCHMAECNECKTMAALRKARGEE